ncbi:MAG: hypothetical protein GTO40_12250 [Deltaproteobacteria bacterium]|nr:hypothetical protein [Deltaproteobacteria bacterium]
MFKPELVSILSDLFKITYCRERKDVDPDGGEILYGHIEDYKGEIRVFDSGREGHRTRIMLHEVFHSICDNLGIKMKHGDLDRFAVAWADTLLRNGWLANTHSALPGESNGEEKTASP